MKKKSNLPRASMMLSLAALSVMAAPTVFAEESNWYLGANVGQSRAKIDDGRITSNLLGSGYTTDSISDDDRDIGYKVFGGRQFNKYFAIEGGYFNLGEFGFTANTTPAGTLDGHIKIEGLNIDAVGTLPLTEKFSVLGRVGVTYAETEGTYRGTGAVNVTDPGRTKRDTNYKVGLGLQYALTKALAVRGEVERYRINDSVGNKGDIDLFSLGLVYRFGGKTKERAAEPEPSYVAMAAPKVVVVTKVNFETDSLFDFNKSAMKPSGKRHLDKLAADLQNTKYQVIKVTGYTDRIGSHKYNMKLSKQRADAVKDYLVTTTGIPGSKIKTTGKNGSNPVTKPGECKGEKATKALIACLQPDRRVEVEVLATEQSK